MNFIHRFVTQTILILRPFEDNGYLYYESKYCKHTIASKYRCFHITIVARFAEVTLMERFANV